MINKAYKVIVDRTCPSCGLGFTNTIGKNVYECNYSQCHARFDFSLFSDEEIKKALSPEAGLDKSGAEQPRSSGAAVAAECGAFPAEPAEAVSRVAVKEYEPAQRLGGFVPDVPDEQEEEPEEAETRLKLLSEALEHAEEGIQLLDLDGHTLYANRAMERLCGSSPKELRDELIVMLQAVKEEGHWSGEVTLSREDGRRAALSLKAFTVTNGTGLAEAIAVIASPRQCVVEVEALEAPPEEAEAPPAAGPTAFEQSLGLSLERGELAVYYQPLVDSSISTITGAEALVRWNHPERGLLTPAHFIPAAEATGFILSLDEWVLSTACRQAAAWKGEGSPGLTVTVNLSGRRLMLPGLAETVERVLRETGLPPGSLELELSESAALQEAAALETLLKLREQGVLLALDDFGAGLSSLRSLRTAPVQRVKIDRAVIRGITENPADLALVKAIIAAGDSLGLKVVAEGVETVEQLLLLQRSGCDNVQGYYFSTPVPAAEFKDLKVLYR